MGFMDFIKSVAQVPKKIAEGAWDLVDGDDDENRSAVDLRGNALPEDWKARSLRDMPPAANPYAGMSYPGGQGSSGGPPMPNAFAATPPQGYMGPSGGFGLQPGQVAPQGANRSALGNIVNWMGKNPEIVTGVLGTAADVYSGVQADKRTKEALNLQRESLEQRKKEADEEVRAERMRMLMQAITGSMGHRY